MESKLTEKFWNYIVENNPDLMFNLQENYSVMQFLRDRVSSLSQLQLSMREEGHSEQEIESACMDELTKDLRPSRYNYIRKIILEDFSDRASDLRENGTLTYEIINMINLCAGIFITMNFAEASVEDMLLRNAVMVEVGQYLGSIREIV